MDRTALKKYAPKARTDFIAAITDRAGFYGLTKKHVEPVKIEGNVAIIGGRPFDRSVAIKRMGLERRIAREGFDAVMEAIAYTWFNRFVAIRYMELHGYLDHGYRVLSHPEGKDTPEIVEHAQHVTLPGLSPQRVIDLKLAGDKDADLYRMLLVAQCNALYLAMPFLFERIDDETELLLPDNLLHTDSLVRRLVREIPEENWQEIEVIGWIYQFYISEKKDEVIGKVVKSEDIPAATQLFTPNWIVKYLVQNSIGRQWLATYPDSPLRKQMEYYIEPAEQTPEVQAQLKAITPESLNPEEMTLLDPACGSGHILVEAYDLFKAIYQERGYRAKDIPRLILRKNLFGLEIDDRAAQLAAFALIMKARADDRRVLEGGIRMNVRCIQSSDGLKAEEIYEALTGVDVVEKSGLPPAEEFDFAEEESAPLIAHMRKKATAFSSSQATCHQPLPTIPEIRTLLALFKGDNAKTFGSLIQIPESVAQKLPGMIQGLDQLIAAGDLGRRAVAERFAPIAEQALMLARRYHAILANPPYIGSKAMNPMLKDFAKDKFPDSKFDLFAVSIERFLMFANSTGFVGLMTPFTWMFIKSYETLRNLLIDKKTLRSLIHPEYHAVWSSAAVPICTFVVQNYHISEYKSSFIRLTDFYGEEIQPTKTLEAISDPNCRWMYKSKPKEFKKIPGSPIAYWASRATITAFGMPPLSSQGNTRRGLQTGDKERFIRQWYECDASQIEWKVLSRSEAAHSGAKWFLFNNGGDYRKWYGNISLVVEWGNDGETLKSFSGSIIPSEHLYFREAVCWGRLTSSRIAFRLHPSGAIPGDLSPCFYAEADLLLVLAYLNSECVDHFLNIINPTLTTPVGDVAKIPIVKLSRNDIDNVTERTRWLVKLHKNDWDTQETSWGFESIPLLRGIGQSIAESYAKMTALNNALIDEVKTVESEINGLFSRAFNLSDEITTEVPLSRVTLSSNPLYRYSEEVLSDQLTRRYRGDSIKEIVSYAIGSMMGRYSLDESGLIYGYSGNEGFDPSRYTTFPADADGIIPLTDYAWFDDDATMRFVEFIGVAWPKEHLEENLDFVAESLGTKGNESSRDTIRRYLANGFFKDHLQIYKLRPVYWLFSSGKERAFQCLVYLHRYNEGTLARMRTEYVIPLQGKMSARIEHLKHDIAAATSTAHGKKLQKEHDTLRKHLEELRTFDEKLNHYAAQRIPLDLDDGVKVNYAKFGDLLAEVKAVTGGKAEEE